MRADGKDFLYFTGPSGPSGPRGPNPARNNVPTKMTILFLLYMSFVNNQLQLPSSKTNQSSSSKDYSNQAEYEPTF
jgi:hypothetical protein